MQSRLYTRVRLEYTARISRESAGTATTESRNAIVSAEISAVGTFAKGIVAALAVYFTVGRVEVEGVAVHGFAFVEPAFGE